MSALPVKDETTGEPAARVEVKPKSSGFSVEQLRIDLSIDEHNIDSSMTEQASLYGYYAALYAKAQMEADHAKNKADVAKARAYKDIRSRLISKGAKFSEALLEAEVIVHSGYQDALELAAKYKMQAEMLRQALEALKQRRDMLVQKGKSLLEERRGNLVLKGREPTLEDRKAAAKAILRSAHQEDSEGE